MDTGAPDNGVIHWDAIAPKMQTGDLLLFSGTAWENILIQQASGPFSHATMVWRRGSDAPCLWEEATEQPALDPITNTLHVGAQLGEARTVTQAIVAAGDTAYYRPLIWNRPDVFDQQVWNVMRGLDGIPFPSNDELLKDYASGRVFNVDTTSHNHMFCSMLVAKTYQAVGLLNADHPPNYYSPSSFSSVLNEVVLQGGAKFGSEIQVAL